MQLVSLEKSVRSAASQSPMLLLLPRKCWNRLFCWYSKSRNQIVSLNLRGPHLSSCLPTLFIAHSSFTSSLCYVENPAESRAERTRYLLCSKRKTHKKMYRISMAASGFLRLLRDWCAWLIWYNEPNGAREGEETGWSNLQRSVRVLCWAPSPCNVWLLRTDLS